YVNPKPRPPGIELGKIGPLGKLTSKELVALLSHPNDWYCRESRRILAERRDASIVPALRKLVLETIDQRATEALWALYVSGGFTDELGITLLTHHASEDVRAWTVRLLCDPKKVSPAIFTSLVTAAKRDPSARVRSQLACS